MSNEINSAKTITLSPFFDIGANKATDIIPTVTMDEQGLAISFTKYGAKDDDAPIFIEFYNEELLVHLFTDIDNTEAKTITMERAKL